MSIINKSVLLENLKNAAVSASYNKLLDSGCFEELHEIQDHKIIIGCYRVHRKIFNHNNVYGAPYGYERGKLFGGVTYLSVGIILDPNDNVLRGVVDTYNINEKYGLTISNTQIIVKNDNISFNDIYDSNCLMLPYVLSGSSDIWVNLINTNKTGKTYIDDEFLREMSFKVNRSNICNHTLLELELNQNNLVKQLENNLQASAVIGCSIEEASKKITSGIIIGAQFIASSNK